MACSWEDGRLAITIFPQNGPCHQVLSRSELKKCKDSEHLQREEVPNNEVNLVLTEENSHRPPPPESDAAARPQRSERGESQSPAEEGNLLAAQDQGATEHHVLLSELIEQAHKQNRWRRISTKLFYIGVLLFMICGIPGLLAPNRRISGSLALSILGVYGSVGVAIVIARKLWGKSLARLAYINDIRAVGALAEALDVPENGIRTQAQ